MGRQVYSQVLSYCRTEAGWGPWASVPVAGAAAGVALSCILSPAELLKVRDQERIAVVDYVMLVLGHIS